MLDDFGEQLIVAEHHIHDIFRIPWTVERSEFYPGSGYLPHVRFDGKYSEGGAVSCSSAAQEYRGWIHLRLDETGGLSPVEISGVHWIQGDSLWLSAAFRLVDPDTLQDTRAFLLVLVNNLEWHGTTYLHLTREAYDEEVLLAEIGDVVLVTAGFAIDPEWEIDTIECIAFIQRMTGDKEVYQSARLPLALGASADDMVSIRPRVLTITPNPFVPGRQAGIALMQLATQESCGPAQVSLEMWDQNGRLVRRLLAGPAGHGTWMAAWDGRDDNGLPIGTGSYWLRLTADGRTQGARLVLIR